MRQIYYCTILMLISLILSFSNNEALAQKVRKAEGKISSDGYWLHDKVEEIPGLKSGPFVRLGDGSILTVEKNMSCISKDEGKTWTKTVVIAGITENSKVKRLAYPRVFEASPGEIWVTTTYSGFGGYLSVKLFEEDFVNNILQDNQ